MKRDLNPQPHINTAVPLPTELPGAPVCAGLIRVRTRYLPVTHQPAGVITDAALVLATFIGGNSAHTFMAASRLKHSLVIGTPPLPPHTAIEPSMTWPTVPGIRFARLSGPILTRDHIGNVLLTFILTIVKRAEVQ
jgi:hypothetical protein